MTVTRYIAHRLHQTSVSRFVRNSPVLNLYAERWWVRLHSRALLSRIRSLKSLSHSSPAGLGGEQSVPSVPTLQDAVAKLPAYVTAGEEFSAEMAQYCCTSKFLSITALRHSLGYQDIYAHVLRHLRGRPVKVLEIGIGVNDPSAPSGMPRGHVPGASLAGWSRYFPGSEIHGADIDPRCMHASADYTTHIADQRDAESLRRLAESLGGGFDLVVDDGLHTPEANGNVIATFLPLLAPTGVMVIEDISPEFDELWFEAEDQIPAPYRLTYFPSTVLRQYRGRRTSAGIAVIVHRP